MHYDVIEKKEKVIDTHGKAFVMGPKMVYDDKKVCVLKKDDTLKLHLPK